MEHEYVLGTHDAELDRLGLQHQVWSARTLDAWIRAGFSTGQTLIDLGCGPGEASLDLAEIVGRTGRVLAIDQSEKFLTALRQRLHHRNLTQIEPYQRDLDREHPPNIMVDGAWARWIFAFVRNPRDLLARTVARIKPGGAIVIHEYFHYTTWRLTPECPLFEEFVATVVKSWRAAGGEPDIGLRLPLWLEELGFRIKSATPLIDIVEPSNFIWQWPRAFLATGTQRLVDLNYLSAERAREMLKVFETMEACPGTRMITPAVLEIIAARPLATAHRSLIAL